MSRKIDLIFCAGGNKRFASLAILCGLLYGSRLPETVYHEIYFADQDWKNPNREKYVEAVKKHKPHLATVLDWEEDSQLKEVLGWAEDIAPYVQEVIIIPKIKDSISRIPLEIGGKKIRLGYSVPTKHGKTDVSLSEFTNRKVHLLGGTPHKQMELALKHSNIVSVDCNYQQLKATKWCSVWILGAKRGLGTFIPLTQYMKDHVDVDSPRIDIDAPYVAFIFSCMNIKNAWEYLLK